MAGQVRRDGGLRRQAAQSARRGEPPPQAAPGRHHARQSGAQGSAGKKLVTPAVRRPERFVSVLLPFARGPGMRWYQVTKTIKGHRYRYLQRTYRIGKAVK